MGDTPLHRSSLTQVFICGMPHEWDEDTIREYWGYCGAIESLDMLVFPDTGNFNGVMFLTFASEEAYEKALACNGEEVEGRTLRVSLENIWPDKRGPKEPS